MAELISTRASNYEPVNYTEALLQGEAPDGGLYVPVEYPLKRIPLINFLKQ